MPYHTAQIVRREGPRQLQLDPSPAAQAGQYLLAWKNPEQPIPIPLFPSGLHGERWLIDTSALPAPDWQVGDCLRLRGPLGRGFRMPAKAQRVVLAALDDDPAPLLPLIGAALARQAAVALFGRPPDAPLPPAIEIRPQSELPEGRLWGDYLALTLTPAELSFLPMQLGIPPSLSPATRAEALVRLPMPCGGIGECAVCALDAPQQPLLACKHGPVFPLHALGIRY